MSLLRIYLFGAPRLERDGETIPVQRRKAMALLAYLAVTGQPHSRDALATLLWPEQDQSSARTNLRRDLSRLKQALGEDVLLIDRTHVGANPEAALWLDVAAFQANVAMAQQHDHPSHQLCADCLDALTEAVTLYTEDFMAGFTLPDCPDFDEWQFFQTEGLRQSLAEALQQLIGWYVSQKEFERGIEYGRRWLALDPLHEPAHRQLMRLYAWSGQQAAALRQYEECVRLLGEELGVEPQADTTALYEAIRTRRFPSQEAVTPGEIASPPNVTPPPQERYVIERPLAVGGQGEVYLGADRLTGEPVIIKQLRREVVADSEQIARFVREGEALRQLNHPNIVRMLAAFERDGQHCIVTEYVPGGSLRQLLDREGQLSLQQALDIALELSDALSRAHHLGIIHRDIKPENVLLAADGTPRLTDFGIAHLKEADVRLTRTGLVLGSPAYMSPEALRGEELDTRSDIWSFGVLLYEMVAGKRPFPGEQIMPVMISILNDPLPQIAQFQPDVPPTLAELLQHMLAKEPDRRIASMRLVAAGLEAIRAGRTEIFTPQPASPWTSSTAPPSIPSATDDPAAITPSPERAATLPGGTTPGSAVAPTNLTPPPTRLIGREQELAEIRRLLLAEPNCRLLTLIGPGGIGKTRLALEAALQVRPAFPDGVFFVSLAPLSSPDHIVAAIAETLGFHFYDAVDPRQQLLRYLSGKELLLVMDNFEHVLAGATLLAEILRAAPAVTIMVTSRESLNLSSETIYTLSGLSFPDDERQAGMEIVNYGAVELLLQQAHRVRPDFEPGPDDLRYAARVCRLVQGMPLALVLAAGWLELLSLQEIAAEIASNLDILEGEMRDLPQRQRSVRAAFDYSWKRLAENEQQVFMKLSLFRGSFSRQAAQAVAGAGLRTLRTLTNKSFLLPGRDGRYGVHELLRQYGEERLEASSEIDEIRDAHSRYYLRALHEREADLKGRRQVETLRETAADFENLRAAWNWALRRQDWDSINCGMESLHLFCDMRGRYQEGIELFARARERLASTLNDELEPIWGRIVTRYGFLQVMVPSAPEAVSAELEQGLAIAQKHGNKGEIALGHQALGTHNCLVLQDPAAGLAYHEQSLELFRRLDDHFYAGRALFGLGLCYAALSDPARFSHFMREGLEMARRNGNKVDMAVALSNLAEFSFGMGEYAAAEDYCRQAIAIAGEIGIPMVEAYCQAWLGLAYLLRWDVAATGTIVKESLALAESINHEIGIAYATSMLSLWASLSGDYEAGRQYGEESQANPANNTLGLVLARWGLAIAYNGLELVESAWRTLKDALVQALDLAFPAPPLWLLPVAAILLAREGEKIRATELMALAFHHPLSPTGWLEKWPLLLELRANLEDDLGAETYQAAWERGKTLSLETVVTTLL